MSPDYDFASLLDAVAPETTDEMSPARPAFHFDHLAVAESLRSADPPVADSVVAAEYANAFEPFEQPVSEAAPARLLEPPPVDAAAVSAELDLSRLDAAGLGMARREFARRNHPDCVPASIRDAALARMQIANAMIDEAEKLLLRQSS